MDCFGEIAISGALVESKHNISMKVEWEVSIAKLTMGIGDVRAYIRDIKRNMSWMNSQLVEVLDTVRQFTSHTYGQPFM